jgi:transposase
MIDYETFVRLRRLRDQEGLGRAQIARALGLDIKTVRRWVRRTHYGQRARPRPRSSKLDPHKSRIKSLLEQHPYSAAQLLERLRKEGYPGGYSILKEYVRQVRPVPTPAFLTLHFAPGEAAQVDWGSYGTVAVGSTRRRLSFFVMVLGYSRMLYVEFTLAETLEHFLACHQNAFEYFGSVPGTVILDNLKSAVLERPSGKPAVLHPRYLDLARHFGFQVRPCTVRRPQEKGRVERAVGYVKSSFLNGLDLSRVALIHPAVRHWLDTVANVRLHGETHATPRDRFAEEKAHMLALPPHPYDVGVSQPVVASLRFRVTLDTNRYSVPFQYAGKRLVLRRYPDRVALYNDHQLIAEHPRSYDRHQDFEHPDHVRELLRYRRTAREQRLFVRFLSLSPCAEQYYQHMAACRLNPKHHAQKILALSEIYGRQEVAQALQTALQFHAFSSDYIANLLEQRRRLLPPAGPVHLTHGSEHLELELPEPDLTLYDPELFPQDDDHEPPLCA